MILLAVSFVAGVLTTLAPCILPLLPVIVGGSLGAGQKNEGRRRIFTIVVSLGFSILAFTFLLKVSTALISIPPFVWTWVSGGIVAAFGLTLLFPGIWERLPFLAKLSAGSNRLVGAGYQRKDFWGDVVVGAALGPVFSTCSPTYFIVLATVLPESLALGTLYILSYIAGLSLMLLLIGLLGQRLADRLGFAADPKGVFKRTLGVLFILVGLVIVTGFDKKIQIKLLDWGLFDVTKVEQWLLRMTEGGEKVARKPGSAPTVFDGPMRIAQKAGLYPRAPEIMNPAGYVNTPRLPSGQAGPITIGEFKGKKVVLLDIWTYSCINCQRTIPYLKAWDEKYRDHGLQIIGIHTPEFAFEKDIENVEWATQQFGIKYPSVLDNDYETWRALGNNYWPRKYLVDIDGFIVYDHIGEGAYEETEAAIQRALEERAMVVGNGMPDKNIIAEGIPEADLSGVRSPETYFGSLRNEYLANGMPGKVGVQNLTLDGLRLPNALYLEGAWDIQPEYAETAGPGTITFRYSAKDVYLVAAAEDGVTIRVLRDGVPVGVYAGEDIDARTGSGVIKANRLYKLIHDENPGPHTIEIKIEGPGLRAYAFTFG